MPSEVLYVMRLVAEAMIQQSELLQDGVAWAHVMARLQKTLFV